MNPGIYTDMDEQQYLTDRDSLSASGMKLILKDPAIYRHALDNPPPFKDHFDVGHACHAKVLGVGAPIVVIDCDDKRGKKWSEPADAARAAGEVPLLKKDADAVDAMAEAVLDNKRARQVLTGGQSEVSLFWHDPEWELTRRARLDHLVGNVIGDLKTTTDSDPKGLDAIVARYHYDLSAVQYLDVARGLDIDIAAFGLVFVRKEPPHLVAVADLDQHFLELGRQKIRIALERFRDCAAAGVWRAYDPNDIHTLTPPHWAYKELEAIA